LLPSALPTTTLTTCPFTTGIPELVWTLDMQALGDGLYRLEGI
jgi:hypothetical protein